MLRDMVKEFAQNEVAPLAKEIDENGTFPQESINKMAELGLMGIPWPEEFGGTGMDFLAQVIAIEELGKVCPSTAATMMAHTSLGTAPIFMFGTDEQKQQYLPKLASGEMLGAFGLTEPNAGSDAGATQTRAVLKGDEFVVNGQKVFCTNAGYAGVIIFTSVLVEDGEEKGVSAFLVDAGTDGLSMDPPEKKMGWKASDTRTVYFQDMRIPKTNVLGNPEKGFKQFLKTLTGGRITIGALSIGTAQGAYESALQYSQEREAFGKTINSFQGVSFKLADMATQIEAARHLVYHAAWKKDRNLPVIKEAAMAKLFASETAMKVSTEAIQVLGGYGYIKEYDVERFFRDAKVLEIGEGTSEVQRIIISREILKSLKAV
ncbi:MAG: acyl-CoA dehydrogenase family protein [Candidatus Marinimicrobia bacterium]|nr:acyl-CoA dehydrogenase family protein [Candidatus Neomarinimicrobiota bacterium]MBL7022900.1 acyl-CoA dehydrogenase family protein [Candidatus Neomarinimicrobiota bacterium]MBL7109219.1 acyl-CoA dehydrogenase family protein [Candidatus Neomarinimicrobiota bacterium]